MAVLGSLGRSMGLGLRNYITGHFTGDSVGKLFLQLILCNFINYTRQCIPYYLCVIFINLLNSEATILSSLYINMYLVN